MKCRAYELELGDVVEIYYKRHYVRQITDTHFILWYYDNSASGKSIEIGKKSQEWVRLIKKGVEATPKIQRYIPVIQYDKKGYEIARYRTIKEAAEKTGGHESCIQEAIKGVQKTSGGFIWKRA